MARPKKMNSGGFVGKKAPDDDRPINQRLAERDNVGSYQDDSDGPPSRLIAVGGKGGPAGVTGFAKASTSVRVGDGVSVEPWVSVEGSSRFKNSKGAGVSVRREFARGGLIDPWNYKK
jgi:hypothetical protein